MQKERKDGVDNATKDLILLNAIQGFGYERLKILLNRHSTTSGILNSGEPDIVRVKKVFNIEKEIETIDKEKINIVTIFDSAYPETLKQIHSPPIVLYARGDICVFKEKAVAVVGCRKCTPYGAAMAKRICSQLAMLNIATVSGMARGIDTAAHRATIEAEGKTIAILGSGLMDIYPPENKKLSGEIIRKGLLVSEFPLNTPPVRENFPRRNRVISGLSKGVVVVEAPEKSGALITADFALEQGKDVFALPGNVDSEKSKGCNNLIKQGAKLIEDAADIIEELFPEMIEKSQSHKVIRSQDEARERVLLNIPDGEKKIYELLSAAPVDIDTISESLNLPTQHISASLLNLEIKGFIRQLPGKLYIRK